MKRNVPAETAAAHVRDAAKISRLSGLACSAIAGMELATAYVGAAANVARSMPADPVTLRSAGAAALALAGTALFRGLELWSDSKAARLEG